MLARLTLVVRWVTLSCGCAVEIADTAPAPARCSTCHRSVIVTWDPR
ncbi:hypothetical protein [Micromonospora fulviviridis]|uniref:Uncharacterized protein n=1 Tax=Micromonospora fulviviridis TaxID=47860 RepID=A0ABV2VS18_9ACTN